MRSHKINLCFLNVVSPIVVVVTIKIWNSAHYWPLPVTTAHYWSLLVTTGHYWVTTGHYCPLFAHYQEL